MTFPAQLINTTAPPKAVKLTNEGTSALSISSLKSSGEFQIASTCGNSVPAGASCTISAVFEPKSGGTHTGLITLVDSASSKPQVIELSGAGTIAKVSPLSLKFGSQKVGSKSASEGISLTNEGSTSMSFESIGVGGADGSDFSEINTCVGRSVPPGGNCEVRVVFTPTRTGTRTATLYLTLKSTTSPQPVTMTGTGN